MIEAKNFKYEKKLINTTTSPSLRSVQYTVLELQCRNNNAKMLQANSFYRAQYGDALFVSFRGTQTW